MRLGELEFSASPAEIRAVMAGRTHKSPLSFWLPGPVEFDYSSSVEGRAHDLFSHCGVLE